jgi:hypothetical protein
VLFLVLGIALQAIANGAAWDWWAGGSFGGRRFDSTYLAFALGASLIVEWIARVVPPALQRGALVRARAHAVGALAVAFVVLELVVANLHLVSDTTTTNVRMTGGEAASEIIGRSGLVSSRIAALASSLSNLPVRAVFAWRHGVALDAYDRVVGVHVLGETYPGLNSFADVRNAFLPPPRDGHGRVLIGLNRRGSIEVTVPLDTTGMVRWNGREVPAHFKTDDLRRGTNELDIDAPAGAVVLPIRIEVQ